MKNISILFIVFCFLTACSGRVSGDVARATTVNTTEIKYIFEHPEEYKEKTVTIKGKVTESSKLFASKLKVKDDSGKEISVKLPSGTPVSAVGAEVVIVGKVMQGIKLEALGIDINDIWIEQTN